MPPRRVHFVYKDTHPFFICYFRIPPPNSGSPSADRCNMLHPSRAERQKPGNQGTTMGTLSSGSSRCSSPTRRTCNNTMSLSVSAVSPTRGSISRMSSSESSVGSPSDSVPRQRTKKRTIQLVFPYAPAVVSRVSFPYLNRCRPSMSLVNPASCIISPAIPHRI
jgi:hypothetical protein